MISAQIELFTRAYPELLRLFPKHWEELALFRDRMPLAPNFMEYAERERAGRLFLATVRWDGKIVAYYTANVASGLHYSTTLTAQMDMVYVHPDARGRGLIVPLMNCVQRELKRRGAQIWYSGYKTGNPLKLDNVLENFGFKPADTYVAKWIGSEA